MKKTVLVGIFCMLLLGTLCYAKESNFSAAALSNPKNIEFRKDDSINAFESENWWLKKYGDITFGSSFFYVPLPESDIFAGVYTRFDKGNLLMFDYVVKEGISKGTLERFYETLGYPKQNDTLGIPVITKKNGVSYFLFTGKQPRLIAASALKLDSALLKKHIAESGTKITVAKKEPTVKKAPAKKITTKKKKK